MRSELKMTLVETVVVVGLGDIIQLARGSGLWPKRGQMVEATMDEDKQEVYIRIQAPEEETP